MDHRFGDLIAVACLVPLIHLSGCSSPTPGGGSYSSLGGTLEVVETASYDQTMTATMSAMEELSLRPHVNDRDGFRTFIVGASDFGVLSQTHEVRVWVTKVDDASTRVEMRIMGRRDEERLLVIKGEIEKKLGKVTPAASVIQPAAAGVPAAASARG
jgi:hypothetical protein